MNNQSGQPLSHRVGWMSLTAVGWLLSIFVTAFVTNHYDHRKLIDQETNQQKVAEIGQFLNANQEFYPAVADFVQQVKVGKGSGSKEQKALISNLTKQYSSLETSATYLSGNSRQVAASYQSDLTVLIRTARDTDGVLDAKPFVNALSVALPRRCEVIKDLRNAAQLPTDTLDPACGANTKAADAHA